MSTGRNRASRSLGNKLNQIETKAEQAATAPKALPENSVTQRALAPESVGSDQYVPNSVDQNALANGAVQTQNLGTVNQISSDSQLALSTQTGVSFTGPAYAYPVAPSGTPVPGAEGDATRAGRYYSIAMDYTGSLVADAVNSSSAVLARVSKYYSKGPVPVYFVSSNIPYNTEQNYTPDAYAGWISGYTPQPGDSVLLVRDIGNLYGQTAGGVSGLSNDAGWIIMGTYSSGALANSIPTQWDIPLAPGVSGTANYSASWASKSMARTAGGIVTLSGLVNVPPEGVAPGGAIYQLPTTFRPDFRMDFPMRAASGTIPGLSAEGITRVSVYPDGRVTLPAGATANGSWISLDNIQFPAAGVARWVPVGSSYGGYRVTLSSNFVDAGDDDTGSIGWWRDSVGMTWFKGMAAIASGYTPSNNAVILSGSGFSSSNGRQHFVSIGTDNTQGGVSSNGNNVIEWQTPSTINANVGIALAPAVLAPSAVNTSLTFANSWTNYGGGYSAAGWYRRFDGLAYYRGVIKSGTLNASAFSTSAGFPGTPSIRVLQATTSNFGPGRVDINANNTVNPQSGSNSWFSIDGRMVLVAS